MFRLEYLECLPEFREIADSFLREWYAPVPYITAHTSGSTGSPKEIRLLKEDMFTSARSTNSYFDISRDSILLSPLSASYIAGKMMIVRGIAANCRVVFTTPSNHFADNSTIRKFIIDEKPSIIPVVPSQLSVISEHTEHYTDILRGAKNIIIGGAAIAPSMEKNLCASPGNFYATYGMTETCSHVALRRLGLPVYHAMPGVSFKLDQRGCLIINAPAFSFKSIITNDIVELSEDSQAFIWKGRYDNIINSGGIKIFPEEIEQLLQPFLAHPLFIKGLPHPKWGEAVALVTTAPSSVTDSEILSICSARLPRHAIPFKIIRMSELPRTSNGKLLRHI